MSFTSKKIKVLYIDDEINNLRSFQASFRRNYEIDVASSAAEGMGILNEKEIHVIIADQRMPQSTGVDFFNVVRLSHPEPIRILLTGYSDIEAIIDAVNKGEIYRYIKKPWDELELTNAIQNAYDIYSTRLELKQKMQELEKKNDELNRFVYSTSHDLRSPLASIMGVLNLAKLENSIIDPNNYLTLIENCVNKMDVFIQKIIEYYKGIRAEDEYSVINLEGLLKSSVEVCSIQNPNISFEIDIQQSIDFVSDEFRLSVIVDNLVSNAVKYQKPSEENPAVKLHVKIDEQKAEIIIEDNGIGILNQHLNNIFQMFFRSTNSFSGLGIGLYIVKEALSHLGGEIAVQSEYGVGTTFRLHIPNMLKSEKYTKA
jgi:signal transduction histidine kinase